MKKILLFFGAFVITCAMQAKTLTLDVTKPLNPTSFTYDATDVWTETYNEDDYDTFDYDGFSFSHAAWTDYNFWYGFTVAKSSDTTYSVLTDQFHCVAGGGLAGKGTPYILAYPAEGMAAHSLCEIYFTSGSGEWMAQEVYLCMGSWAMENVLKGGSPARTFAEGDSLVIEIEGLDDAGEAIDGSKVIFYLADYRSSNHAEWHLNTGWEKCDLSKLGFVYGLRFTMKSSDVSGYYANTALYFALDGLKIWDGIYEVATFENEDGGINLTTAESNWFGADSPADEWNAWKSGDYTFQTYYTPSYKSAWVVTNETTTSFDSFDDAYRTPSGGAYQGDNFAVWNLCYYGEDTITFAGHTVPGFWINNSVYAVSSMSNGDSFAKKFGVDDWFKLTITGLLNNASVGTIDFYLAQNGKYVSEWTYVDLSSLGDINGIQFSMSSTDEGAWGMNTPAYFAMDNFGDKKPDGYVAPAMTEFPGIPSAIENTEVAPKATKIVRNGQLIILRGVNEYNAVGQTIK